MRAHGRSTLHLSSLASGLLLCLGCVGSFDPRPVDEVGFLARAERQSGDGVTVVAAVPSARETRELFGSDLYGRGIQPVWLEIENGTDEWLTFLPVGLDPQYFTPIEAAMSHRDRVEEADERDEARNRYFLARKMNLHILPGETRKGFVFTKIDEGTKAFNVDLMGETEGSIFSFTFFVPVPGLAIDHHEVDWEGIYPEDEVVDLDESRLIAVLEKQPCCTTDKNAKDAGDPLNLVVIGDLDDVYYAFIRAGWDETEAITGGSLLKMGLSFFSGGEYRYSPVSGLYVFGRPQDVAFQKARDNIHERNHLRLWLSAARFNGKPVWLGQISRDIGVRFTRRTITTHKIDPDVDETREFLLEDLAYAQALAGFGYVGGVGRAPIEAPRRNLTGDPYFTDGHRLVLWVTSQPVDIGDVEMVEWAWPDVWR